MRIPFLRSIIISGFLFLVSGLLGGCMKFDEQVLRDEFDLPASVRLVAIDSRPKTPGWFGREGLQIWATFEFQSADFDAYRAKVERDSRWKPLPLTRSFIVKITGVRRTVESRQRAYELRGETIPEPGSIYNPTEHQLLEEWMKNLPLDIKHGFYRCLTAGNNLLYASKVSCFEKPGDLNDFMLAVLDLDHKIIRVRVHTAY